MIEYQFVQPDYISGFFRNLRFVLQRLEVNEAMTKRRGVDCYNWSLTMEVKRPDNSFEGWYFDEIYRGFISATPHRDEALASGLAGFINHMWDLTLDANVLLKEVQHGERSDSTSGDGGNVDTNH